MSLVTFVNPSKDFPFIALTDKLKMADVEISDKHEHYSCLKQYVQVTFSVCLEIAVKRRFEVSRAPQMA